MLIYMERQPQHNPSLSKSHVIASPYQIIFIHCTLYIKLIKTTFNSSNNKYFYIYYITHIIKLLYICRLVLSATSRRLLNNLN